MKKVIITIYTILPVVAMALTLTSCDNDGDNTGSNWILAILWILVWLKGGKR